ncbi:MAG TPA: hypothetical protein PL045_13920, partial [Chitinophagaceae bacterium]|nr:hypothetical protein [Chitinophagaceae bacterium]
MYERKTERLAPVAVYYQRLGRNFLVMMGVLSICLWVGILGYHYTANIGWLDSLHNASMILAGMGPVVEIKTNGGKWFSSFYAIFSGVAFITNIGYFMAPAVHRFFHSLH